MEHTIVSTTFSSDGRREDEKNSPLRNSNCQRHPSLIKWNRLTRLPTPPRRSTVNHHRIQQEPNQPRNFLRETSITSREDTIQRSRIRASGHFRPGTETVYSVVLPTFGHFRPGTETAYLVILPTSGHFRPINVKAKHNRTAIYEIYRTNLDRITAVANALPMETTLYNSLGPILRAL